MTCTLHLFSHLVLTTLSSWHYCQPQFTDEQLKLRQVKWPDRDHAAARWQSACPLKGAVVSESSATLQAWSNGIAYRNAHMTGTPTEPPLIFLKNVVDRKMSSNTHSRKSSLRLTFISLHKAQVLPQSHMHRTQYGSDKGGSLESGGYFRAELPGIYTRYSLLF